MVPLPRQFRAANDFVRSSETCGRDFGFFDCGNSFVGTTIQKGTQNVTQLNDEVLHRGQGPQGRVHIEVPKTSTVVQCMPIEAEGRLRYRIKSDLVERVVTEDELSFRK